jgi:hypothetical protein
MRFRIGATAAPLLVHGALAALLGLISSDGETRTGQLVQGLQLGVMASAIPTAVDNLTGGTVTEAATWIQEQAASITDKVDGYLPSDFGGPQPAIATLNGQYLAKVGAMYGKGATNTDIKIGRNLPGEYAKVDGFVPVDRDFYLSN